MIAVDWGTSNLRAYRLDRHGQVRDQVASANGITKVAPGGFPAVLLETSQLLLCRQEQFPVL